MPATVPCPTCKKEALWDGNNFRPFCSERCKLIDLGEWATGKYGIPTHEIDSSKEDAESANQEPDGFEDD